MITLLGGPCAGSYAVKRAPRYLRAVIGPNGKRDVLDQYDDTPAEGERVYIYRLHPGTEGVVHLKAGKGMSGFYALGTYTPVEEVDGEQLRDTEAWRSWATARAESDGQVHV